MKELLEKLFVNLSNHYTVKALCIGDLMLDKYLYGNVDRISPEAPVPVFLYRNEKNMLGGAGNVAVNLASLGCDTTFLGVAGVDQNATILSRLFKQQGIKHHLVKTSDYPTIVKTRIIASNQHILRIDNEEVFRIDHSIIPRLSNALRKIVSKQDIVLLSDYNKGVFGTETCQMVIDLCNELNKKTIVDPKGKDYSKYQNAYLVKPNLKEFKEATGLDHIDPMSASFLDDVKVGAEMLYSKYKIKNLIVTLSEYGMVYVSMETDQSFMVPTVAKEVFDVSGAGDTSLAALGKCIASGLTVIEAMVAANIASGIVVGKIGTASVTSEEIRTVIKHQLSGEIL